MGDEVRSLETARRRRSRSQLADALWQAIRAASVGLTTDDIRELTEEFLIEIEVEAL
jgi:hypothetical protein